MSISEGVAASLGERKYLRRVAQEVPDRPVVLIGSYARRTRVSPTSDIDLLVLDKSSPVLPPPNVQVITIAPEEFRRRAAEGDDFSLWALRFGVPLSGNRVWQELKREVMADAPWPSSAPNRARAVKRVRAAEALLEMGDLPAAQEETLFALSHVARAELLASGIFPLSRPELPTQLDESGRGELAAALREATGGELTRAQVREALGLVRATLSRSSAEESA